MKHSSVSRSCLASVVVGMLWLGAPALAQTDQPGTPAAPTKPKKNHGKDGPSDAAPAPGAAPTPGAQPGATAPAGTAPPATPPTPASPAPMMPHGPGPWDNDL